MTPMIPDAKGLLSATKEPLLAESIAVLNSYSSRGFASIPRAFWAALDNAKSGAVGRGDQTLAAAVLCLETAGRAQDAFVSVYEHLRAGECQSAWIRSIDCEDLLSTMDRYFDPLSNEFGIGHVRTYIPRIQELFPPMQFASMGAVALRRQCGICQAAIRMRRTCEHILGEIYDGEFCYTEVTEAELLEVSLTDRPADRRCIVILNGHELEQDPRLAPAKAVADILPSPWARWNFIIEAHVHSAYRSLRVDDPCPCGSASIFGACHLRKEPLVAHFQFLVEHG